MEQQKPLMLKEYLELESSAESPRWAPLQRAGGGGTTVRSLLETDLRGTGDGGCRLLRSRSTGALTRLSAAIRAVGGGGGVFSRSLSKRLRLSFWKKSGDEEEKEGRVLVTNIARRRSFDHEEPALMVRESSFLCPPPVVSRLSISSDADNSIGSDAAEKYGDFPADASKSQMSPRSPRSFLSPIPIPIPSPSPQNGISVPDDAHRPSTCSREKKEMCGKDVLEEEKEQLSPVSIMDFPYLDEDDEQLHQLSPSFQQFISNIERTKNLLLQKIRRFESLAELDPVDLDPRFAGTESTAHVAEDEEEAQFESEDDRERRNAARSLLRRLTGGESLPASGEKLLFDFFVDGLADDQRRRLKSGARHEEMLRAASQWVAGCGGVEAVWETEMSGRWRRFEEEEVVVAAEIAGGLVGWLMEELVDELVSAA